MKSQSLEELILRIKELQQIHLSQRGILQYVAQKHNGKDYLKWGSSVPSSRFKVEYKFDKPINDELRSELNEISEYMNQNFIVRLNSLLDYEGIKNNNVKIDDELIGNKMIKAIHGLRKHFAHRLGDFNPDDEKASEFRNELFEEFDIDPSQSLPNQFPLHKNKVIKPIVEGTIEYVSAFWKKNR